jgi:hypothetical protein
MGFSLILIFIPLLLPHSPFSFLSAVEKGKGMWQKKIMKSHVKSQHRRRREKKINFTKDIPGLYDFLCV